MGRPHERGLRLHAEKEKKAQRGETLKKGDIYVMDHHRKGPMTVEIVKDNGEWVDVKILKGKAHYASIAHNLSQRIYGHGTKGDIITVRKTLADWKKETKKP